MHEEPPAAASDIESDSVDDDDKNAEESDEAESNANSGSESGEGSEPEEEKKQAIDPLGGLEGPVKHKQDRKRKVRGLGKVKGRRAKRRRALVEKQSQRDTPKEMVRRFRALSYDPQKYVVVNAGRVFCRVCNQGFFENTKLKMSTLKNHLASRSHKARLLKQLEKKKNEQGFLSPEVGSAGFMTGRQTLLRRLEVTKATLIAAVAFEKFDVEEYRDSVQGNGPPLGGASTMREYIPQVLEAEKARIKSWVSTVRDVSGEYDGSCVMHDAMCYILRGLSEDELRVDMNLVDLRFFGAPLNTNSLARYIENTTTEYIGAGAAAKEFVWNFVHDRYDTCLLA
jgi:hypothetical protein